MNWILHGTIVFLLATTSVFSLVSQQRSGALKKNQEYVPEIPEKCLDIGICENVPNYPKEYIASILEKITHRKKIKIRPNKLNFTNNITEDRNAIFPLCDSVRQEIIPKAARSKNGNWYFIVNEDENPIHQYLTVQCNFRKNKSCKDFVTLGGVYNNGECRQKHVEARMLVINEHGMAINETFEVPSCCSCMATKKIQDFSDLLNRTKYI